MTQRPIKFRAWNIPTKQMFYWGTLQEINRTDRRNIEAEHNIFEQFTGLHDKNGKEIYEGDIVKKGQERGEVYWDNENSRYVFGNKKEDTYWTVASFRNYTVLGNIHENPELVAPEKEKEESK